MISQLIVQLKGFTDEEPRGFFGMFRKAQSQVDLMKSRYDKVQANVDKISRSAHRPPDTADEGHRDVREDGTTRIDITDRELSMNIQAGRLKLRQTREHDLPALQQKARASGPPPEDAQACATTWPICVGSV